MDTLIPGLPGGVADLRLDLLGRLILAALLGGLVGFERELSGKPAGLRTNLLICVGAALLTDLSVHFSSMTPTELVRADPARIAAQIVSGIGFLGAGTIIQARGSVTGLTTAATLWVVAAIGMAVGSGFHLEAAGTTVLVLIVLVPLGRLEGWVHHRRTTRGLRVRLAMRPGVIDDTHDLLEGVGLRLDLHEVSRDQVQERVELILDARGSERSFRLARERLSESGDLESFWLGAPRD